MLPIMAEEMVARVYLRRGTSEELGGFASAEYATAINYGSFIKEYLVLSWEVRRIVFGGLLGLEEFWCYASLRGCSQKQVFILCSLRR